MDLRRLSTKILSVILCAVMILSAMPLGVINAFASSDTVPEGYTEIYDIEDLDAVRNDPDGNYILMADIDMTEATAAGGEWDYNGTGWRPIGESYSSRFIGIFDGNGHKITGMRIKDSDAVFIGLFGYVNGGTVKNLRMVNADIQDSSIQYAGTIAGYADSATIENIAIDNLTMNLSYNSYSSGCFGGIVGYENDTISAEISKSYVSGTITANGYNSTYVGGIAGTGGGLITDCYNASVIKASSSYGYVYVGGISGSGDTITNCINIGVIISGNDRAHCGAINSEDATLSGCYYKKSTASSGKYNTSDTAETAVALIVVQMKQQSSYSYLDFENTWVLDVASGAAYPQLQGNRQFPESGVIPSEDENDDVIPEGYIPIYDVADLYSVRYDLDGNYILMADIDMTEATAEGGEWDYNGTGWVPIRSFSGIFDGNGHSIIGMRIKDTSSEYVGLFGYIDSGTVKNLRMVNADIQDDYVRYAGTIAGYAKTSIFENIAVDNLAMKLSCNSSNISYFGGIVGYTKGTSSAKTTISKSYVSGGIYVNGSEYTYVGGIVGYCYDYTDITDCYNTATITGNGVGFLHIYLGGISGSYGSGADGIIMNCVNVGSVSGTGNISCGAINGEWATLSECYYKKGTASSGKYNTIDGLATVNSLTEEQMKLESVYGWLDFENTWVLDVASGAAYPQLQGNRQFAESGVRPPEDEHDDVIPEGYTAIYDIEDLYAVRYNLEGNYILMADIDMTEDTASDGNWSYNGEGWRPIGFNDTLAFKGIFDGNGHKITGMRIKNASCEYVGLFGHISGGTVKNLRMVNADIADAVVQYAGTIAGTIAGYANKATLENIAIDNFVMNVEDYRAKTIPKYYGGIVGYADGCTISKSYVSGTITVKGDNYNFTCVGGIVGVVSSFANISDCYNAAAISANGTSSYYSYASGISGAGGTITNCVNIGVISGTGSFYCGAISGHNAALSHCYYKEGTASSGIYNTSDTAETAVALTEEQMKQQESYSYLDFENTWFLDTDMGMNYPQLQSCPEKPAESIVISSYPSKTAYLQHEELDVAGLKITVNYEYGIDPEEKDVTITMVTGYDATVIGTQTLTVTYLGKTATFDVVVAPRPVTGITLDMTEVTLEEGMTQQLTATVIPDNATDKTLTWTSDDESVVTVDNTGLVTAQGTGTATITATATNGVSASAEITVLADHTYGDTVATITATCFATGSAYKTCTICGHVENITLPIDSTNHSGGTEVRNAVAGNCGQAGYTGDTYCLGCNTKIADGEEIPATENHNCESEITTPSTCSVPGVRTYTCTVCDYMYTEDVEPDPDAHDMSAWEVITEPTCNTEGRKVRKCAECGQLSLSRLTLDENTYPESDHDYLNNENKDYPLFGYESAENLYLTFSSSTYFEDGYDFLFIYDSNGEYIDRYTGNSLAGKTITIPGDSFSLRLKTDSSTTFYGFSFDKIEAEVSDGSADYVSIPATGNHDYVYSTTREATCAREGEITYTCSDCGDSYAEIIEKTAHNPGDWQIITGATADTDGIKIRCCTVCGTETDRETIPAGTGVTRYLGDASGDGKVTAADARLILRHSARIEILPDNVLNLADVNGDGRVNASDARIALRMASKLEGLIIYGSV